MATHPAFVLGMVFLGPAPMLVIGQLVIFANRAPTRARLVGNAAVYAVFLVAGSLLARLARDSLGHRHHVGLVLARGRRPVRRDVGD